MAYVGTPIDTTNTFQSLTGDRFDGDASETAFTLSTAPASTLDIEVFVGNVRQDPNSAYTLSGTTLTFTGAPPSGTNNIYVVHQAKAVGTIDPPATETVAKTFSGALTANGGAVFNEGSADVDFRVESNGNANAIFVNGGEDTVGIGNSNAHSFDDNADNLVVGTGSGHNGITIYSDGSSSGSLFFANGTSGAQTKQGQVLYEQNNSAMVFNTASTTENLRMNAGKLSTGGETAADVDSGGITLNHGSNDSLVMTFKNSDVAHGITDQAETDTYGLFRKNSDANGGFKIISLSEGDNSFHVQGFVTNDNTTQNASAGAPIKLDARKKSGTSVGSMGANANLLVVQNDGTGRFIVDEDGDILYDGSASGYDSYDDAQLVRAVSNYKNPDAVIQDKFDKFVKYNYKDLQEAKILGTNSPEDNAKGLKPFIKIGALQRLHNGAIWQQYTKHQQLLEAVYDLAKEAVGEEKANAILDKHEVKRLN
jgi:hypothetical protein